MGILEEQWGDRYQWISCRGPFLQPRDLHGWLRIATDGLAARAKERIRLEIEAHYAEAVSDHLREGLSESDARTAALAKLGSASKAAKCFLKYHLTTREAEKVGWAISRLGSRWWLLFNYIFCACLFFAAGTHYRSFLIPLAAVFIPTVIIPTFNFVMVRRKTPKACYSILMELVAWYAYGLFFIVLCMEAVSGARAVTWHGTPFQSHLLAGFSFWLVISLPLVLSFIPVLRGWLRLRHIANVWDEIPHRNVVD